MQYPAVVCSMIIAVVPVHRICQDEGVVLLCEVFPLEMFSPDPRLLQGNVGGANSTEASQLTGETSIILLDWSKQANGTCAKSSIFM